MAELPEPGRVRLYVQTDPGFDHSTAYRLQRLLAEFRVRSVATQGSTFTTTPAEGSTLTFGGQLSHGNPGKSPLWASRGRSPGGSLRCPDPTPGPAAKQMTRCRQLPERPCESTCACPLSASNASWG
jgi:hypothetical protein